MEKILIPTYTDSYDSLTFVNPKCVCVYKKIGYTPLQVVNDIKPFLLKEESASCTYVGRLDPMAEGWMHVLWSGDMEEKKVLSGLSKTYEVEVLFGFQTDTGDVLGLVNKNNKSFIEKEKIGEVIKSFIGSFAYPYPTYSSPNIKKTLKGETVNQDNIKIQQGHIYSADVLLINDVSHDELKDAVYKKLSQCHMNGDFRLDLVKDSWKNIFDKTDKDNLYNIVTIRVSCSSGTYMRTLASEFGKKLDTHGLAFSIKRIGIGKSV